MEKDLPSSIQAWLGWMFDCDPRGFKLQSDDDIKLFYHKKFGDVLIGPLRVQSGGGVKKKGYDTLRAKVFMRGYESGQEITGFHPILKNLYSKGRELRDHLDMDQGYF